MKGSYIEVLATHGGPDLALATREGAAKRWTGVHAGRLLSLEISESGVPTWSDTTEGNTAAAFSRAGSGPRGVGEPAACV
jgi:hypothetical protein